MTRPASAVLWSVGAVTLTYAMFFAIACGKAFRANVALGLGVFPRILITPSFWIISAVALVAVMIWRLKQL
jgi:hypothetical protein